MPLLKEGDVIELKHGHHVYMKLPKHCIFTNTIGVFDEVYNTEVSIGDPKGGLDTTFLVGRYIVTKTNREGGGGGSFGPGYHDGHHVFCRHVTLPIELHFYQTGCFTAMIKEIEPVGRATNTWTIEPDKS